MNKIFKIIWNATTQTWVVVSELTRAHTKRASATVATTVLATVLSTGVQASSNASGGGSTEPDPEFFNPEKPNSTDEAHVEDAYRFGLAVLDEKGEIKDKKLKNQEFGKDEEKTKYTISVEATESGHELPTYSSSFLYLQENGGIEIEQNGRLAKFKVKTGNGLKIDNDKVVADTVDLTVNNGKVGNVNGDGSKLVNAGNLAKTLNELGWRLKAGTTDAQTVKSGEEVEFKGEGVTVTTKEESGKHIVTIKATQTQGGGTAAGGAWKAVAGKDGTGEVEPETPTAQEISAGDTVTFKAGDNLKVKQSGKDFTYSLKETLTGLTSVTLGTENGEKTVINKDGLTITPTAGAGATVKDEDKISVTKDGIKAGNKEITNVASGLTTYNGNDAKKDLVNLTNPTTGAGGTATTVANSTAATVGDLRGLGWVLSSDKTTSDTGATDTAFHQAVKNAAEVEFVGKNGATVSAKTDAQTGKHTVTVDVANVEAGKGLEKTDNTIKLKVDDTNANNVLTVDATKGASVTKGSFETGATDADRGKVKVTDENGTDADKRVATVKDVANAINDASTFVKVANDTTEIEGEPTDNGQDDALKAGDTLTLKAGKNLKVKREGKDVTFALAKDLDVKSATVSDTLTIGGNTPAGGTAATPKVNITSTADGLKFAKEPAANGDTKVHLTNIASTLDNHRVGGNTTHLDKEVNDADRNHAATVGDVLNSGWNIKGAKTAGGAVENIDFVATYDTVDFVDDGKTTIVTVKQKDNQKGAEVKIGAKTSVIKEKDGKLVTGKEGAVAGTVDAAADNDTGTGLVTAETVINAVNNAGWRVKTTANGQAGQDGKFETVTSGTKVTFADGDGTKATVTKTDADGVTVKYNANVGDGLKLDNRKITADTTTLTVNDGADTAKPKGKVADVTEDNKNKLVNAGGLADALNKLSWTATAGQEGTGEEESKSEQEVKAGDKVTFKAGNNLKVKQSGKDFTYSLKETLTGLTSVTLGTENGEKTVINKDG
ncbi:ESPR-type extended signal peptide-containing protein, partial [Haemophilus parahaemolyticus]